MWAFSFLIACSGVWLIADLYRDRTQVVAADGGTYVGAMVGQTRFINPVLSQTNDIDASLTTLIFSSLLKTDPNGQLIGDLADRWEVSEDRLTYTFHIKAQAKWHDGQSVTAEDIIYTIKVIQDDSYYSPLIANWKGIRAEKVDDQTVRFVLKNPYAPFLNNLTFGILPEHLWSRVNANEFPLSELNFKPVGSGPYQFESYKKDKNGKLISISLSSNDIFYGQRPHIKKMDFIFYQSESDAITAFNRKEVKGIDYLSPEGLAQVVDLEKKNAYRLKMPRHYAVFFNQTQSKALSDRNVRVALSSAVDKAKLVSDVLKGTGTVADFPIPEGLLGYDPNLKTYPYSTDQAKTLLDQAGWVDSDGDGVREKGADKLAFTLVSSDLMETAKTANMLSEMWKAVGANVTVETSTDIQENYIKPRAYEALLFGEILKFDPDPFSFWHSSQKKDPGLNLALYDNTAVDKVLEEARKEVDPAVRAQKYQQFQQLVIEDAPAIFLYRPDYLYLQDRSIKGMNAQNIITPSDRFNDVEYWYIKTKRVAK